jgi:uncharacterized protein involved in exopolysaccharide biosynthesis
MTTNIEPTIDIRPYLAVVWRQRYLIFTFCVSAALASLAMTYVVSEKYVASATILYQPNEAGTFRPKDREALGFPTPMVSLDSIGDTLDELAKSDAVIDPVVRTLGLDVKRPRPPSNIVMTAFHAVKDTAKEYGGRAWELLRYGRIIEKNPFAQAMATLRKNLEIRRTAKAYTFQLEVVDTDPAVAAATVDQVAQTLAKFLEDERLRQVRATREGLAERLAQNETEIATLRADVDTFRKDTKVSSLAEELSLKLKTLESFREEHSRARNDLQALRQKRDEEQEQLSQQKQSVKYDSTSAQNPVVEEMQMALAKLEVERSGLLGRFTEQHQDVRTIDAKMAQVRKKLESESSQVVKSESVRTNDIYQKLLGDRLSTDAEIEAVTARIQAYDHSIAEETGRARDLAAQEQRQAKLLLQLASAERSYVLISEAYEEARIAESRASNEVSILHKAFVPQAPSRPIKIYHVGLSAALSFVLAIGLAFLFDFLDTSIRRIDQVQRVLNLPVLATIPVLEARSSEGTLIIIDRQT